MSDKTYCVPRHVPTCDQVIEAEQTKAPCPTWRFCLPWGGSLAQNSGGCVEYTAPHPTEVPEDGIYDKVIIVDGCIVGVEKAGIPVYQASPCAPVPTDCEGGDGTEINPSTMGCNILRVDASGRPYVCISIQGQNGIDVSGTGTPEDPIIVAGVGGGGDGNGYVKACNDGIKVSGNGSREDPWCIAHKEVPNGGTTAGGLSIDRYGHIIGEVPVGGGEGIQSIIPGDGIHVENRPDKGTTTIGLEAVAGLQPGAHIVDNWSITVDDYGRVIDMHKIWTVTPHTFRVNCVDYTVNEDGVISNIQEVADCGPGGGGGGGGADDEYTMLKYHLFRAFSEAKWESYTVDVSSKYGSTVATFSSFGSDNSTLTSEYDENSGDGGYVINFTMAQASALFIRIVSSSEWNNQGGSASSSLVFTPMKWSATLDGRQIIDYKKGNNIMVRTKDVYAAGPHSLKLFPFNITMGDTSVPTTPDGFIEIMTTALR